MPISSRIRKSSHTSLVITQRRADQLLLAKVRLVQASIKQLVENNTK
jgi:hypothetical protein